MGPTMALRGSSCIVIGKQYDPCLQQESEGENRGSGRDRKRKLTTGVATCSCSAYLALKSGDSKHETETANIR